MVQGEGKRSAISRSNSRNRIATRKKRIEKGKRAFPIGSKPHSYGESFSASGPVCGNHRAIVISTVTRAMANKIVMMSFIIPSRVLSGLSEWKSFVLLY